MAGGDAGEVEVITDPAEVAAAREAWRRWQDERLTRLLARPWTLAYSEGFDVLPHDPQRSRETLVKVRDDPAQPAAERFGAIHALTKLGVPPAAEKVAAIASSDPNAAGHFLVSLQALYPTDAPLPDVIRGTMGAALTDERVRNQAEWAVVGYKVLDFEQTLLANARQGKSLWALASLHPTPQALELLLGAAAGTGRERALVVFVRATRDPALRRRAIDAVVRFFADMTEPAGGAEIGVVAEVGKVEPVEVARAVLASIARVTRDDNVRRAVENCLRSIDEARRAAEPPNPRTAATFARLGVITAEEAAGTPRAPHPPDEAFTSSPAIRVLVRLGRYVFIERIAERIPYRHDFIIRQLGDLAAAPFRPEAVMETYRPLTSDDSGVPGEYHTQFIHAGRLYRFDPPDLGYQYNVPAVIAAVTERWRTRASRTASSRSRGTARRSSTSSPRPTRCARRRRSSGSS